MAETIRQDQSKAFITGRQLGIAALLFGCLFIGALSLVVNPVYLIVGIAGLVVVFLMVKYDYFGLLVYLLVFLGRPGEAYPILATIRIELILGAALSFLALIKNKYRYGRFTIPDSKLNLDMILILGAMCLSFSLASCKDCTVTAILDMVKLGIFFLLIILTVDSVKRLELFFWAFIIINAKLTFDITWGFYHGQAVFNQGLNRATGGNSEMDNFNGIAITMNTMIPFVYFFFNHYRNLWKKAGMLLCLLLFVWTLVITGSRGGLVGFVAILGMFWWQSKNKIAMGIFLLLFMAVAWAMLGSDTKSRYSTIFADNLDDSSENRIRAWQDGLEMMMIRPLTGVGAGAFAWARFERFGRYLNPHNMYVQVLAELGFIGAFIYFMFLADIFRINKRILKRVSARGSPLSILEPFARSIMTSSGAMMVTGMFAHSAFRYTWYVMAAMTVVSYHLLRKAEFEEESLKLKEAEKLVSTETVGGNPIN
jgi:putative inorganic carbon (HCO3(-)) transporter